MPSQVKTGLDSLHSRYNPRLEAERYLNSLSIPNETLYFILIEPGKGYLIPVLRERYPGAKIIALHAFEKKEYGLETGQIPSWFYGSGVPLQKFLEQHIDEIEARRIRIIEWRPALSVYGKSYLNLLAESAAFIKRMDGNIRTARFFGRRWIKNFFKNLSIVENYTEPPVLHRPLIVTGSGPGLDEGIPAIKKTKDACGALVIAASSSVPALVNRGIDPDIIVSTDGGYWALLHLHACMRCGGTFILASNFCAALPSSLSPFPFLLLNDGSLWQNLIINGLDLPSVRVPQRGTVTAAAVDLAFALDSAEVFIAGMDFGCRDIQTHIRPYSFDKLFDEKASRFYPRYSRQFVRAFDTKQGGSHDIYASWFKSSLNSMKWRLFSLGGNHPVFNSLKPWNGKLPPSSKPVSFKTVKRENGLYPKKAADILIKALENPKLAYTLRSELSSLLMGEDKSEKNVSLASLCEELRRIGQYYTGGSHGI
jgi:hypothetical protein